KSFILVNNYSQRKLQKYKDDKSKITYIGFTVFVTSITFSILALKLFKDIYEHGELSFESKTIFE
ncbi:hypothetical protein ECE26_18940, partial [Acinetobacter baumannii]|nr:hypothetical protein [Acinetobacter baumannii]